MCHREKYSDAAGDAALEREPDRRRYQRRRSKRDAVRASADLAALPYSAERHLSMLVFHTTWRRGARNVRVLGRSMGFAGFEEGRLGSPLLSFTDERHIHFTSGSCDVARSREGFPVIR